MSEQISFISMYDDMLSHIKDFNQKNYEDLFKGFLDTYGPYVMSVIEKAGELSDPSEKEEYFNSYAESLSLYVKNIIDSFPEKKRQKYSVDHNVNMVAYFLPVVTYYKLPDYMTLGETFVKVWNDNHTTSNVLQLSSYEAIGGGFKKSIFCYITTAVCDTLGKADDCYELTLLRNYRDQYLAKTEDGKALIKEYYEIAPRLVLSIDTYDSCNSIYSDLYSEYILPCIKDIENEKLEDCKEKYVHMVRSLEEQYIAS